MELKLNSEPTNWGKEEPYHRIFYVQDKVGNYLEAVQIPVSFDQNRMPIPTDEKDIIRVETYLQEKYPGNKIYHGSAPDFLDFTKTFPTSGKLTPDTKIQTLDELLIKK